MKKLAAVLFVLVAGACTNGDDVESASETVNSEVNSSTTVTPTSDAPAEVPPQDDLSPEGLFYFADVDFLSEGERVEYVPDEFALGGVLDEANALVGVARVNERWVLSVPEFPADLGPFGESGRFGAFVATHPATSYSYECADGRHARVDHFVRDIEDSRTLWTEDSFLGDVTVGEQPFELTFYEAGDRDGYLANENPANWGYLRPTGEGGPFAGAEYIHRRFSLPSEEESDTAVLRYGFYQYFSFIDADDVEVEVLVSAATFDFTQDFQSLNDPSPTITSNSSDPFELVDHEMVQARFDCGREAAELIAPVVAALDHSTE